MDDELKTEEDREVEQLLKTNCQKHDKFQKGTYSTVQYIN